MEEIIGSFYDKYHHYKAGDTVYFHIYPDIITKQTDKNITFSVGANTEQISKELCRILSPEQTQIISENQMQMKELRAKMVELEKQNEEIFHAGKPAFTDKSEQEYNWNFKRIEDLSRKFSFDNEGHYAGSSIQTPRSKDKQLTTNSGVTILAIAGNYVFAKQSMNGYLSHGAYAKGEGTDYIIFNDVISPASKYQVYVQNTNKFSTAKQCFENVYAKFCELARVETRDIWGKQTEIY
jgi:hypothetical protein